MYRSDNWLESGCSLASRGNRQFQTDETVMNSLSGQRWSKNKAYNLSTSTAGQLQNFSDCSQSHSRRPNSSIRRRRPSFDVSTFCSPILEKHRTLAKTNVINSPYYYERTSCGGVPPYGMKNVSFFPKKSMAQKGCGVRVTPVKCAFNNESECIRSTRTRRIQEILEGFPEPGFQVELSPNKTSTPTLSNTPVSPADLTSDKSRLTPNPVKQKPRVPVTSKLQDLRKTISKKSPQTSSSNIFKVRELTKMIRNMTLRVEMENSLEAARLIAASFASTSVSSCKGSSEYRLRFDDAEKTRRCGGKTKGMKMELTEETVEEVNLPNISLPVTPPTNFDLVFPSAASTPVVNTFESASPITVTENAKTCSSVDKFTNSNPLSVAEHEDTTITNNNESNCVISPAIQVISDKDSNLGSSGTEKGDNSEMCFDVEPATEVTTESVANILDRKVESTDKDDLNEASSSSMSLDKLKASPETWECATQKICNKSDETKFAAGEIPHSSAGSVSSSTPVQVSSDVEVKMSPDTWECTSCHEQNSRSAAVCSKCTPGQSYSKPFQYSNDEAGRNAKAFGGTPPPSSFVTITTTTKTTTGGSSSTTTSSVSSGSQVLTTAPSSVVAKPTDTSSLQQGTSSFGVKQTSKLPPNKDKRQSEVPKRSQSSDSRDTVMKTKRQKLNELEENSELIKPVGTLENKKSEKKSHNKKVSFSCEFTKKPTSTTKTVDTIKPAINFGAVIPGVANFSSVQPSTTTSSFSFTSSNTMAAVTTTVTTTVLAPITTVTTSMTGAPVSLATTTSASNWFSSGVPKSSNIFGGTSDIAFGQPTTTTSSTPSFGTSLKTSTAFTLNFAQSKPCGSSNKGSVTTTVTTTVLAPITTVTTSMTGAPVSLATTTSASNSFSFGVPKSSNIFGGTSGIAFGQPTTTTSSTPSFGASLKTSTAFTLNFAQSKPCGGSNKGPVPNIVTTTVSAPITTVMTSMTGAPVSLVTTTSASNWFSFRVPKSSNIFGGTSGIAFGQPTTTTSSTPSFGTSLKTSTAFTLNSAQSKPCGGSNKGPVTNTVTTTVSAPITTVTTSMTGAPVSLVTTTCASNSFSFGVPKSSNIFGGTSGIAFGQPTTTTSSTPSFGTSLKTSTAFTLNSAQSKPCGGSNKGPVTNTVTTTVSAPITTVTTSMTGAPVSLVTTTCASNSFSFRVPKSSNIFGGTSGIAFGQPTTTTSSTPSFGTSLKTSTAFTLNSAQSKPCGGSNKGPVTNTVTTTVSAPITTVTTSMTGAPVSLVTTTCASNSFSFGVPKSSNIFGGTSGIAFGQPTTTTSSTPSFGTSLKTSTAFTLNSAQSKPCGGSNKGPVTNTVTTTVSAPITTVMTSMTGAPVSLVTTTSASNWFSFRVPKSSNIFGGTSGIAFGQPTTTTSSTPSFGTSLKTSTAFTLNSAQSKPCGGSNKGPVTNTVTTTVSAPITTVTTSMTGAPVSLVTTTCASNSFSFGVPKSSNIFGGTSGIAFGQPTTTTSSTPSFGTSLKTSTAFTLNSAQSKPCGGSNKGPVTNTVTTTVSAPITTVTTSMTGAPVSLVTITCASNSFSFGVPKSSNIFGGTSGIAFGQPTTTTSSTPSFGTSLKTSTAFTLNFAQSKPCGGSNKGPVTNTVTTTVSAPITTVTTSMTGAPVSLVTTTCASNSFSFGVPKSSNIFGGTSGIAFGQPTTTTSSTPSFGTSLKTSTAFTLNFAQSKPCGGSSKAPVTTIASEEMAPNFRSITSVATTTVTTTPAFSSISSLPSFSMDITGAARSTIPVYGTASIYTSVLPTTSNTTIMTTGFGSTPNFGAGFSNPATGFNSGSASNSRQTAPFSFGCIQNDQGLSALASGAANKGSASAVSNARPMLHKSPLVRSQTSDSTTKGLGMDVDDGTVEEVNLPNIPLPTTSLPRSDSVVPPTASTRSVISTSKFPRGTVRPNLVTRRVPPIKPPVNFGSEAELKKPVETWQCMYCHVQNLSSASVCSKCGARQKNGTREAVWPPGKSTVQPSNAQNTCTCREKNPFSWRKCPVCDTNRPRLDTGTQSPLKQPVNFGSGAEFKKPAGTLQQNSTQIKEAVRPVQPSGFKPITNTRNTCTCRDGNPFSWKKCQVCEPRPPKPPANVEFREKFKELAKGPPSFGTNLKTSNKGPVTTTASKEIHNIFGSVTSAATTIASTTAASRNTTSSSSFGMATTTPSVSFNMGALRSIIPTSGTPMSVPTTNNTTMTTDNDNEQEIISNLATAFNICSVNNSRAPRRRPRASDFF